MGPLVRPWRANRHNRVRTLGSPLFSCTDQGNNVSGDSQERGIPSHRRYLSNRCSRGFARPIWPAAFVPPRRMGHTSAHERYLSRRGTPPPPPCMANAYLRAYRQRCWPADCSSHQVYRDDAAGRSTHEHASSSASGALRRLARGVAQCCRHSYCRH